MPMTASITVLIMPSTTVPIMLTVGRRELSAALLSRAIHGVIPVAGCGLQGRQFAACPAGVNIPMADGALGYLGSDFPQPTSCSSAWESRNSKPRKPTSFGVRYGL
jgi:hypothetical protein